MSGVLLDTNVVSELTHAVPDAGVVAFLSNLDDAYLSVVTVQELEYGIALKPIGARRAQLATAVGLLLATYSEAIIPVDQETAGLAGHLRASEEAHGRMLHFADALIAATARTRRLTLATRNLGDFQHLGVTLLNPWNA